MMLSKEILKHYDIPSLSHQLNTFKAKEYDIDSLKDINNLKIDTDKSSTERILDFLSDGFSPYLFKIGDSTVEIAYSNNGIDADACIMDVFKDIYK